MGTIRRGTVVWGALFLGMGCAAHVPPTAPVQGAEKKVETRVMEAGAALFQTQAPLRALNVYLDGLHFRSGEMGHQMDVHHYCGALNEELIQCVLFDGNGADAPMVGVEYVISARLFEGLPAEEKAMWHSHRYEVKSGQLIAPGLPEVAEHKLMEKLISTYGKTWHTWVDDPALPIGAPALMMGFTADGQVKPELVQQRDKAFGIDSAAKKAARADIPDTPILPGADAWEKGEVIRLQITRD
jgi:hypothetical protein